MAIVLFLHGLDAQPGGVKPTYLEQQGHTVLNPALPREDFELSVRIAEQSLHDGNPDVIVGSSRGGAVALAMNRAGKPAVLLAPAWRFFIESPRIDGPIHIIHSPHDTLIPLEHSQTLVEQAGNKIILFELGDRHTLTDPESLARMDQSVRELARCSLPDEHQM